MRRPTVDMKVLRARLTAAVHEERSITITADEALCLLPDNHLMECDHCHTLVRTPAALQRDGVRSPLSAEAVADHPAECSWVQWVKSNGKTPFPRFGRD